VNLVHFLIAGVQKCGTSALDAYLRHHPALEMASPKETHFFDREAGIDWRAPDYERLHAHYALPDRMRGEATPITLYWTPAHYRVLRYNPDMRFILLFRDPVERAWSHWKMNRANGWETLSFSDAIRAGRLRVLDEQGPSGLSRRLSYVERGYYGRQISELAKLFPTEHMLFLSQDELSCSPDVALGRVAAFLGVGPLEPAKPERVNISRWAEPDALSDEDRAYLEQLYASDQAAFGKITGLAL
jgi:hypothetical protein